MIGQFWRGMGLALLLMGVAGMVWLQSFGGPVMASTGPLKGGDPTSRVGATTRSAGPAKGGDPTRLVERWRTGEVLAATPGERQVQLSWEVFQEAAGYRVEQRDLATGEMRVLPTVNGTAILVKGLAVGRWYRFGVTPLGDAGVVMPTQTIEVRTRGFQAYDHYYALGDSFSAGDGAPPYMGVQGCYRSMNSYPFLLGPGVPAPDLIACNGATTANVDQVSQSIVPGTQLSQLRAAAPANSLITISIGGNDAQFSRELKNCIWGWQSCTERHDIIASRISALKPRLVQIYQELRQAAPGADILALGYPLLVAVPEKANCHNPIVHLGLSTAEMAMIRQLAGMLDDVIAQAASEVGVIAVTTEVEQAFAGHEACVANQGDEWLNELAGLTDWLHDSFHPNRRGYEADAEVIKARLAALYGSGMVR
ncbi:MAG TPA: GDSL-type esterase/lipase family protein [Ktedonosporobacter sp.]|nr:GDSL-type esterase/lipase family protein [Ktedonosporobacter sp.]